MSDVELDAEQQAAIRQMMRAVVERDEREVASLLGREHPPNVYAAPADDFWMWADNYGEEPLKLAMPPSDVDEWGVWGFPLRGRPAVLALHVNVWSDQGRTE